MTQRGGVPPELLVRYCRDLGWRDPLDLPADAGVDTPPAVDPAACDTIDSLSAAAQQCELCRLSQKRSHVVFGEGALEPPVMFVGEGPGAEEDRTGRPFVGQAGQLLEAMIFALGFDRSEVYIANVVKCRPPGNRDPKDDEVRACSPYLERQIALVQPKVLVALGRPAARWLTGSDKPMKALRGRWLTYRGTPLLITYHPAYALRSPLEKRKIWEDLRMVKAKLAER